MAEEQTQLDQIQQTIELLARHLQPLPEQVSGVEKKVDRLDKKLTAFQAESAANFVEVNDRLDTVETNTHRLEARASELDD